MPPLYPLRFHPLLRHYVWGGNQLAEVLRKPVPAGQTCAESWEIVDHGEDQSIVAAGPLAGTSLATLVSERGAELFGRHQPTAHFPLLLKFLDARLTLSVQVHPNDAQGALLQPPDLGKTEAWVVIEAAPDAEIFAGLLPDVDAAKLAAAIEQGTCDACLHRIQPHPGDCIFLPAGTVHALGGGLLIAEIQQSSDTTYRLFDWNRLGVDGKPRPLHVREALDVIDYQRGPVEPQDPQLTGNPLVDRLAACDQFVLDRWTFDQPAALGGDDRFHVLAVLAGRVTVEGDASQQPLVRGDSLLLPASAGPTLVHPQGNAVILDAYLP